MIVLLRWLDAALAYIFKPFWDADTYESYSNAGYVLGLVVWVPLLFFSFLASGYGSITFDQTSPFAQWIFTTILSKLGAEDPPQSLQLAYLIPLPYLLAGLHKAARYSLGRLSAKLFFAIMSGIVALGEFCIEYRWLSLALIFALSCSIGWGFTYLNREEKRKLSINHSYNFWLESVEDFIEENPVTEAESEKYEKVRAAWNDDFKDVLGNSQFSTHPSECLLSLMDAVYKKKTDLAFRRSLELELDELNKTVDRCRQPPGAEMTSSEAKALALMHLMMGRIHNRVAEGKQEGKYFTVARDHFKAMNVEQLRDIPDAERYRSAQRNGFGTIYASALGAMLANKQADVGGVCDDETGCFLLAEQEYEAAGAGYAPCSFQQKRMENNLTDLLMRTGLNTQGVSRSVSPVVDKLLNNPSALADELKSKVGKMMKCNADDPIIPAIFLTAAQAFGTSVTLRMQSGNAPDAHIWEDVDSAGYHLRLAYSFEPGNITEEDLVYFCFAKQNESLKERFRNALMASHGALPQLDVDTLMKTIKCR